MQPPTMAEPFLVAPETYLLPTPFPVPGLGLLYVNSLVIRSAEPVLVDTGAPVFRQQFLDTAFSLVDPADVRWVFLSHDDRDHSGNLLQVLEACPRARVVTNFVGVGRMGDEWALPMPRVHFANDGDRFDVGDRELVALRPPLYDSPATRGLWDPTTRMYFAADAFGAVVPEPCGDVGDVAADVYEDGFNWFNRANSPWHTLCDPAKLDAEVDRIRRLGADVVVTSHGPAARGRTDQLCRMLAALPTMEPVALPTQQDLEAMLAGPPPVPVG